MFEDEDDDAADLACSMASVSTSDWEPNIDANVSSAFDVTLPTEYHSRSSSYVSLFKAMNMSVDISKLSASIGSFNISSEPCSVFDIDKTSVSKWEEF